MSLTLSLNTASGARWSSASSSTSCSIKFNFWNRKSFVSANARRFPSRSALVFARRRNHNAEIASSPSSTWKKKKTSARDDRGKDDEDLDDDPFEALFTLLEEDLKNDNSTSEDDGDYEIDEEDINALARELEEALGDDGDMELLTSQRETDGDGAPDSGGDHDDGYETHGNEEDETPLKLKSWQLRRLACALKAGRRKANIKNLAAELCLDRSVVLGLLRDPPPNLVMLSATIPDEPSPVITVPKSRPPEPSPTEALVDTLEMKESLREPVHVMQHRLSAKKRLKKVHLQTLNKVYRRSKRPTDAMISSIVQVTNLPRKNVVKWFEDKRAEDGILNRHAPYRRSR